MITITVNGDRSASAKLNRLAGQLKDFTVPNRALSIQLYGLVIKNYDSQGSLVGGWAPLAESTIERKRRAGKEQMLVWSGALRASFLPGSFYDSKRAGVGSQIVYSEFHQEGTDRMPQRELLPRGDQVLDAALKIYGFYVERQVKEANA